ncbi:MAG: YihY/virulence factor BrkB family protein [Eubacterium sp.]|nr:YihY/virulence factor BrkB family protein [Eubacterium sp.]
MARQSKSKRLYMLIMDYFKKCNDDHVGAFGAMSAFFMLLSVFPFLIFFLTMTQFAPFTKDDIINLLVDMLSFERKSMIMSIVNEIYRKTGASIVSLSIVAALWTSSKGVYSIIKGLNSVYDIEDNRNFFVLRFFSTIVTVIFAVLIAAMLVLWVFGSILYSYICARFPTFASLAGYFIHKRVFLTVIALTVIFMVIYQFLPDRESSFLKQWPGALLAAVGWILVSLFCSLFMNGFGSFSYVYGSMASIMILLLWLYFCMSMIFYGAEFNYFLENKKNYHTLVWALRHNRRASRRKRVKMRTRKGEQEEKDKVS